MFVIGQLYEVEKEGAYKTLITYSVGDPHIPNDLDDETNDRLDKVNRNIGVFLSLILCFITGFFLGVKNFSASIMAASLLAVILISSWCETQGRRLASEFFRGFCTEV